jgi:orotate phosphoribosyltransferase
VTEDEVVRLLRERGAVRAGHFLLSSGKHSGTYIEKARVFEDPVVTVRLGAEIAGWYERIDAVISPAVGALPLGFAVALEAGARFLFAEREQGAMALRRGFGFEAGERVLVVEDVVTTGGSAEEVFGLVRRLGAEPIGVAALVDRSATDVRFPLRALARLPAESWDPDACPLCAEGVPLESPGSRHPAENRRSRG